MALTRLQRQACRPPTQRRLESGESHVAGGLALNEPLQASRISRDIVVLHDSEEALARTWAVDRSALEDPCQLLSDEHTVVSWPQ